MCKIMIMFVFMVMRYGKSEHDYYVYAPHSLETLFSLITLGDCCNTLKGS